MRILSSAKGAVVPARLPPARPRYLKGTAERQRTLEPGGQSFEQRQREEYMNPPRAGYVRSGDGSSRRIRRCVQAAHTPPSPPLPPPPPPPPPPHDVDMDAGGGAAEGGAAGAEADSGWVAMQNGQDRTYYYNEQTYKTSWVAPVGAWGGGGGAEEPGAAANDASNIPEGRMQQLRAIQAAEIERLDRVLAQLQEEQQPPVAVTTGLGGGGGSAGIALVGWTCSECTFCNLNPRALACEICNSERW